VERGRGKNKKNIKHRYDRIIIIIIIISIQFIIAADFRLSRWLIIDVNYVLGLLHSMIVGDVPDLSEVHAASIFKVEVCRFMSSCVYTVFRFRRDSEKGGKHGVTTQHQN
jgi:hypothetical protein